MSAERGEKKNHIVIQTCTHSCLLSLQLHDLNCFAKVKIWDSLINLLKLHEKPDWSRAIYIGTGMQVAFTFWSGQRKTTFIKMWMYRVHSIVQCIYFIHSFIHSSSVAALWFKLDKLDLNRTLYKYVQMYDQHLWAWNQNSESKSVFEFLLVMLLKKILLL